VCDSGVEQYVRDSRIMAIYEGTNGIQALDLATRKLSADGARRYRLFVGAVRADMERSGSTCPALVAPLVAALADLESASEWMLDRLSDCARDVEAAATAYLQLVALVALGWMWLRMAAAAGGTPLEHVKKATARFFTEQLLSGTDMLLRRITAGSTAIDSIPSDELCRYPA